MLHRMCREFHALPSQVMAEDGGLMLQLMEVGTMVTDAETWWAERARRGTGGGVHDGSW